VKIQTFVLEYLKWDIEKNDFLEKISEKEKLEFTPNSDFDKKLCEVLEKKDEKEAQKNVIKIDSFLKWFLEDFMVSTAHSEWQWFWKSSWTYASIIITIFKTLKINQWEETHLEYLDRIKFLNFNTDNIEWKIANINQNSKDENLWFYEALENFWENTILKINLFGIEKKDKANEGGKLTGLNKYYNEVFEKHKIKLN
jgi:hypothetical protein